MIDISKVVCLIPTWCTARHAVGAADSMRKYYPNIPIYFADDIYTPEQEGQWKQIYSKGWDSFDPDPQKLINYPNSCYTAREHIDSESNGHGLAITHAMQFIHAKWIVHISTDTRVNKDGLLEYVFKDIDDSYCGSGDDWTREGTPALGSWLFAFRGDLYHEHDLNFKANRDKKYDIGCEYYSTLIKKGFKFNNQLSIMNNYVIHLGSSRKGNEENWDKYY
jgi:hypothetical protein